MRLPAPYARLCVAVVQGNAFALRSWATQGLDLDASCGIDTPLGTAARLCRPRVAQTLLDLGADANVCVPSYGKTECGTSGGLGGVTHGTYPLGLAQESLSSAQRNDNVEEIVACEAAIDLLAPRTGHVPDDLRPAREPDLD